MSSSKKEIFRRFGVGLTQQGHKILRATFDLDETQIDAREVRDLSKDLGFGARDVQTADRKYFTIPWEQYQEINEYEWINKKEYVDDRFDCDDFSHTYAGHMREIYMLNAVGMAHSVKLTDSETDDYIGYHRANVILDANKDFYLYEAMSNEWKKMESTTPVIGDWKYNMNYLTFG